MEDKICSNDSDVTSEIYQIDPNRVEQEPRSKGRVDSYYSSYY